MSLRFVVAIALVACRNDVHQSPPIVTSASAAPSASASAMVDDMPTLGMDEATTQRVLVSAGWSIDHRMAGSGFIGGPPGQPPREVDTSNFSATRAGWTLHATFDWSHLSALTRTSPPLADEASVKAALADIDKRLGARTWSQPDFGPDRDLAMWQAPARIVRASVRHDATGWLLTESWTKP